MIHFGEETEDEVFITHEAATAGVEIENTGSEPLVGLRYFGPDVHTKLPNVGDYQEVVIERRSASDSRCRQRIATSHRRRITSTR